MHLGGYAHAMRNHPEVEVMGIWDDPAEAAQKFAQDFGIPFVADLDTLLASVDAVVICSENKRHAELSAAAANAGKHILCEKPLVTSAEEEELMVSAVKKAGVVFMTAFPCRYSPAYKKLKERVVAGEIGAIKAVCATNHGRCPFGWFVQPELSGGGALVDHVVHVGDLLGDLLGEFPVQVTAHTGNNMYSQEWDDTAMVTLEYASGVFATIDASWSRPQMYKTWGDVTLNVVGEKGVIELDMFGQEIQHYHSGSVTHTVGGYGTNMDALLVEDFIECCLGRREVTCGIETGVSTSRLFMRGYQSVAKREPVSLL